MRSLRLALVPLVLVALAVPARAGSLALIVSGEPAKQPVIETTLAPWLTGRGYEVAVGTKDQSVEGKLVDCFVLTDQGCAEGAVAKLKTDNTLFVMVEVHHDTKAPDSRKGSVCRRIKRHGNTQLVDVGGQPRNVDFDDAAVVLWKYLNA